MKQPLGVILAGGLARRMGGGDKGLLRLGDTTLLQRVIDRLAPQVDAVALNANAHQEADGVEVVPQTLALRIQNEAGSWSGRATPSMRPSLISTKRS